MKKKTGGGGKRTGAGRKRKYPETRTITISVPADLVEELDSFAQTRNVSRSALATALMRMALMNGSLSKVEALYF